MSSIVSFGIPFRYIDTVSECKYRGMIRYNPSTPSSTISILVLLVAKDRLYGSLINSVLHSELVNIHLHRNQLLKEFYISVVGRGVT